MGDNPSEFKGGDEAPSRPVETVPWVEVVRFCNALSKKLGLREAYAITDGNVVTWNASADGFRLPTEAEWECAARSGDNTLYAGSDEPIDVAWHDASVRDEDGEVVVDLSLLHTQPVATKTPNGWGLHDMSGNVSEWCWDYYAPYSMTMTTDPKGPDWSTDPFSGRPRSSRPYRVYRGGAWNAGPEAARVANRGGTLESNGLPFVGFRLARTL